jgi:hypothetical protein
MGNEPFALCKSHALDEIEAGQRAYMSGAASYQEYIEHGNWVDKCHNRFHAGFECFLCELSVRLNAKPQGKTKQEKHIEAY